MPQRVAVLNVAGLSPSLFGAGLPRLGEFARSCGGMRTIAPHLPALTCTSQASILTGTNPASHGIVGNGWMDREGGEVRFWRQSNALMHGEKLWEVARARDSRVTCANCFWWFNMFSSAAVEVTPRPCYTADGRKIPDIATKPGALRDELQTKLGQFPLFSFWGPRADITSTEWIAAAAIEVARKYQPTIQLVYLPHLDYCLQKLGPTHPDIAGHLRELDRVIGALLDFYANAGVRVMVLSEYGIAPVRGAVLPNRALREAGLLSVRDELGSDMVEPAACEAFAVCDHQIAHVYVRNPSRLADAARLLGALDGVEQVLDAEAQRAAGIAHSRSGDLVLVSASDRWFAYPYWLDDRRAPDFARTVDIHRKPGYDPCELFVDPQMHLSGLRIAGKLLRRKLGMRTLLDVIPLDPSLVRGSHGRVRNGHGLDPVLLVDDSHIDETEVPIDTVGAAILSQVFPE